MEFDSESGSHQTALSDLEFLAEPFGEAHMNQEPYILITADTHGGGSHAQYREYLDPKWREAFD
ncbi:hypothetical protein, partial [Candidatus Binatus sp.]|uniref:hypothetical protein n=1 Tax=Candidatus Binatus sp. TaxID=2811406 RepID=UPI003C777D8D